MSQTPGTSGGTTAVQFVTPNDSAARKQIATPWRSRRNTPYTRTPRTRNLRKTSGVDLDDVATEEEVEEAATEILGKTWRIYRVSPLYNFNYDNLKKYPKYLASHVQSELKKGLGVNISKIEEDENADAASMSVIPGLQAHPHDPRAVKIYLGKRRGKTLACRTLLTALLCGVGGADLEAALAPGFTHLPVLLVKGAVGLTRLLAAWLQAAFDCVVSEHALSPDTLAWMLAMWSGSVPDRSGSRRRVELAYAVPPAVPQLSYVTLSLDFKQCHKLWLAIHDDPDGECTEKQVSDFLGSLEHHFFHHFKIQLRAMRLVRVGTAIAYVAGPEGKIKIYSAEALHQVLGHLTESVLLDSLPKLLG